VDATPRQVPDEKGRQLLAKVERLPAYRANRRSCAIDDSERIGRGEADPGSSSPSVTAMEAAIGRDILAIQLDSYGRAAASARAHVLNDIVIVILDGLELQPSEEFLVAEGRPDAVIDLRNHFQQAIAPSFIAAVERATGRQVVGFTSQQQVIEPRFAVEVFRLDPA
jgi:uncharacterized protein YbcI